MAPPRCAYDLMASFNSMVYGRHYCLSENGDKAHRVIVLTSLVSVISSYSNIIMVANENIDCGSYSSNRCYLAVLRRFEYDTGLLGHFSSALNFHAGAATRQTALRQ